MIEPQAYNDTLRAPTNRAWVIREPEETYRPAATPRLLEQVRDAIRAPRMSPRTEEA